MRRSIASNLFVIMGVAGSGKSAVAAELSKMTSWPMIEGDTHHPESNIAKMSAGEPLTNEDRMPWLDAISATVNNHPVGALLLACSALNDEVRDRLTKHISRPISWILLDVDKAELERRLAQRPDHFMPASLLQSQLDALEPPEDAIIIDANQPLFDVCDEIMKELDHQ